MPKLKDILADLRYKSMNLERPRVWASVSLPRGLRVHYNYYDGKLLLERKDVVPSEQEMSTVIKHFPVTLHPAPVANNEDWIKSWHDPDTSSYYRMAEVKEVGE